MKEKQTLPARGTRAPAETCREYPRILPEHDTTRVFRLYVESDLSEGRAYYHEGDYPIKMHTHDFFELNVLVRGKGRHYIENKSYPAEPGDVFAMPPGVRHGYWAEDADMSIFHLLIEPRLFSEYRAVLEQIPGVHTLFHTEPKIRSRMKGKGMFLKLSPQNLRALQSEFDGLIAAAKSVYDGAETLFSMREVCLLGELGHLMQEQYALAAAHAPRRAMPLAIAGIADYMERNCANSITLEDLAARANYSRASLVRNFKKTFGTTPFEFLIAVRIRRAEQLLAETDKSVAEIAQDCGFYDSSHFMRFFRRKTGLSPSEYRRGV